MELNAAFLRVAASRPGVLLAVRPGATRARLAVEGELRRRGWPIVLAPAQADLLVLVGDPGSGPGGWADAVWRGMPAPRARVVVRSAAETAAVLDRGRAALLSPDARVPAPSQGPAGEAADHDPHEGHDPYEGHDPHAGHDMGGHDMAGHDHHMHHGGDVDGVPMASQGEDRDGLKLDRLHVPLGPVLADWPAGLILRLALQGDVVQEATVETDAGAHRGHGSVEPHPYWSEPWLRAAAGERVERGEAARRLCAAHLDSLGRFFAVAGWGDLAVRARRACRQAVDGAPADEITAAVRPLIRRAGRSRTLRWLMAGIGPLSGEQARAAGVTGPALSAGGDAYDRMRFWLEEAGRAAAACGDTGVLDAGVPDIGVLDAGVPDTNAWGASAGVADAWDGPRGRVGGPATAALLGVLPHLLRGAEFACARVIVASLDPDLDELVGARHHRTEPSRG